MTELTPLCHLEVSLHLGRTELAPCAPRRSSSRAIPLGEHHATRRAAHGKALPDAWRGKKNRPQGTGDEHSAPLERKENLKP